MMRKNALKIRLKEVLWKMPFSKIKKNIQAVQVGQEQQLDLQDLRTKYDAMWKLANANKNAATQARASITDSASAAIAALHQIREQFTTANTAQTQQFGWSFRIKNFIV